MDEEEEYTDTYLRRFKNLRMFKGKSDDEIREYLRNRPRKEVKPEKAKTIAVEQIEQTEDIEAYDKLFKSKMKTLQKEYGVDLNDANDYESLMSLVRLSLQQEVVDRQIRTMSSSRVLNTKALKDLGDYQRSLQMSVQGLQQELGISRKARKEKSIDDIPKYVAHLKEKAKDMWNRKTIPVRCPKDDIELARIWVNFPDLNNNYSLELECWKCHEMIIYAN